MRDIDRQPLATYRLQFNQDFRLADAQALVPYWSRLGITYVYASPLLRSRQASSHGYDVVDPLTINPNVGSETELASLSSALRKYGLGIVLDIVPNHMAATLENPYWRDVLTYGPGSRHACWFDIDWRMPDRKIWGRVLVPVLGQSLKQALAQDEIRLVWRDGRFLVQYFDHAFPVDPATVPEICEFGIQNLELLLDADHPAMGQLREILAILSQLPQSRARLRRKAVIDHKTIEQSLAQFALLVVQSPRIEKWAEETAEQFGAGETGRIRLRKLIDAQPYRLVHWRDAARAINYRRFFDINDLISIRQEDPAVFEETHATILRWIESEVIDGLRVDHIDGLRDPKQYLQRLREAVRSHHRGSRAFPVFVEKILGVDEKLAADWPVEGTTGYEFLNEVEAIFISRSGFLEIEEKYHRDLRRSVPFDQVARQGKRRVLRNELAPHVGRLADILHRLAVFNLRSARLDNSGEFTGSPLPIAASAVKPSHQTSADEPNLSVAVAIERQDLSERDLAEAIIEIIVALPVYRTYIDSTSGVYHESDASYLRTALAEVRGGGRVCAQAIDFLSQVLLLENRTELPAHELSERINFVQRFQQLTGPAAAKGIEDTAHYAYVPLVSLNEVGGEPKLPENSLEVLHQASAERLANWPQSMVCVTSHDTKRTADVRARLDVLSEVSESWTGLVSRWQRLHRGYRSRARGKHAPDTAAEILLYQTIVGLWPAPDPHQPSQLPAEELLTSLRERIEAYMLKAVREAKTHTSWADPGDEYENALVSFIRKVFQYGLERETPFFADLQQLLARIARAGFCNSLARTLIQFTTPGTPDLYQGDELWNFALVDPDNRRPVDYELRSRLLDEVVTGGESANDARTLFLKSLIESPEDGRIKLHLIRSVLLARQNHSRLFATGEYLPLPTAGLFAEHLFSFARIAGDEAMVAVVPRLTLTLVQNDFELPLGPSCWADTKVELPESLKALRWTSLLTQEQHVGQNPHGVLDAGEILSFLPVALLIGQRPA